MKERILYIKFLLKTRDYELKAVEQVQYAQIMIHRDMRGKLVRWK